MSKASYQILFLKNEERHEERNQDQGILISIEGVGKNRSEKADGERR